MRFSDVKATKFGGFDITFFTVCLTLNLWAAPAGAAGCLLSRRV